MRSFTGTLFAVGWAGALAASCGAESFSRCEDCAGTGGEGGTSGRGGSSAGSTANPTGGSVGEAGGGGSSTTGGSAGRGTGGDGAGGSSGSAGTVGATGGSGATAGTGGTDNEAGESGAGASGGSAGMPGDICSLPIDSGPCDGAIERYAFDVRTGTCHLFSYGGCEGNANNFETIDECFAECSGSSEIDTTACSSSSECVVIDSGCCWGCGTDEYSLVAVNAANAAAYPKARDCGDVICELCFQPPLSAPRAWYGATCRAGHCQLFDARESEVTACEGNDDCQLRVGLGCCEACNGTPADMIAYNHESGLSDLICGDGPIGCPACTPTFPASLEPWCNEGRCTVLSSEGGG